MLYQQNAFHTHVISLHALLNNNIFAFIQYDVMKRVLVFAQN